MTRPFTAAILVVALVGLGAPAANAQDLPLEELPDLSPLDPVLDPLGDAIDDIAEPVGDIPLDNAVQLTGDDAVDAAIALSRVTFPDGMGPVALLARADLFADSLSSGGAQGAAAAPLLLTSSDQLDQRVGEELERLGTTTVIVLGNELAISQAVFDQLEAAGLAVARLGGPTRIETAIEVARALMPSATKAIVARAYPSPDGDDSQAFADVLAVGPMAAEQAIPILLTQTSVLTPTLEAYLAEAAITDVVIIGGDMAVSEATEQAIAALDITTSRIEGLNRFDTAVQIAIARGYEEVTSVERLILAEAGGRPDVWSAGFAAAAHGAVFDGPILLTDGLLLPPATIDYIAAGLVDNLQALGGALLVCTSFVNVVACEAAALLMLGFIAEAMALLGIEELPVSAEVLEALRGGEAASTAASRPPTGVAG